MRIKIRHDIATIHRKIRMDSQQLQELSDPERAVVTRAMLSAGTRAAVHQRAFIYTGEMSVAGLLFALAATPLLVTSPRPGSASSVLIWSTLGIGSAVAGLLISRNFGRLAALKIIRWPQLFAHFIGRAYAFLVPIAVMGLIFVANHASQTHSPTTEGDLVIAYALDVAFAAAVLANAAEWLRYRHLRRARPRQALDTLILELHSVAARLGRARRSGEWTNASAREIISRFEALAWTAEYYPPLAVRSPLADAGAREMASRNGAQLAAVIRIHKKPVQTASGATAAQLQTVEASLCGALVAWSRGDWAALTEHAPDVVVPRRWFRLWQRLWPAAVLAFFAFTLPLIDAFNVGQVGSSIRISLLVAAALSIVTGGVPVADRVQGAVDKSLGWRTSGHQ
ncbi:hypothetical protein [Streptacidiphilus sp. PAMC 29251]